MFVLLFVGADWLAFGRKCRGDVTEGRGKVKGMSWRGHGKVEEKLGKESTTVSGLDGVERIQLTLSSQKIPCTMWLSPKSQIGPPRGKVPLASSLLFLGQPWLDPEILRKADWKSSAAPRLAIGQITTRESLQDPCRRRISVEC